MELEENNAANDMQDAAEAESWQLMMACTLERDAYILKNEIWTDCEVIVGSNKEKKTFQCHCIYLAKASPVLASMLYKSKKQAQSTIYLPGIKPSAFSEVLSYIYMDCINQLAWEEMEALVRAARHLSMPHLMNACLNHLKSQVNVGNAATLYELAVQCGGTTLSQYCFKIMCENAARVLEEPTFEQISLKTLTTFLEQDNLHVSSDIPLIEASIRWAKLEVSCKGKHATPQTLRDALGSAFSLLRFLSLSPAQFASFAGKTELLSLEECFSILSNLSSPGITELPNNVCRKMETRHGYIFGHGRVFLCQASMEKCFYSSGNPQWCEFCFEFSVNSDLILLGAQICSQTAQQGGDCTPMIVDSDKSKLNGYHDTEESKVYKEDLDITFEKPKPRSRVAMHFDSLVRFDSLISMKFDKPFLILKGEKYRLYVHLRKTGWYPTGITTGGMRPLGAELRFEANKENFFHSLVFTR